MEQTDKGFYDNDGGISDVAVPFRSVTYAEDRLEYFRIRRRYAQKRLDEAIKRRGDHAWTDYEVDDAARTLSFYKDVVKMLEDMENERTRKNIAARLFDRVCCKNEKRDTHVAL